MFCSYIDHTTPFLRHAQLDRSAFKSDVTAFANAARTAFAQHCSPALYDCVNREWRPPSDIWVSARNLQSNFRIGDLERTVNERQSGVVWKWSC